MNTTRLYLVVGGIFLFFVALEVNLARIQLWHHGYYAQVAENQYYEDYKLEARRGFIYDRNGEVLASSLILYDIGVDARRVKNKEKMAGRFAGIVGGAQSEYLKKLENGKGFIYLARGVSEENTTRLEKDIPGVFRKEKSFRRYYPYGDFASQLIGFTDPDDHGLGGLEKQNDSLLAGQDGQALMLHNGPRDESFYNADYPMQKAKDGDNLYLTIDKDIQTVTETALRAGVKKANAADGMAVVLDPNTGEILAMTSIPGFNPNRQKDFSMEAKRNRVVTDQYEPGSTFKIFTAAVLLQENLKKPQDAVFCENGKYRIHRHTFHDTKPLGWLSMDKVVAKSSNIGMIKLSEKLDAGLFFRYLRDFGFGSETDAGLIGEIPGSLNRPEKWSGLSKASIAIGQEIGVTALQMAAAYSAVVNGGYLYKPYAISRISDMNGYMKLQNKQQEKRAVISTEVSDILRGFLKQVVDEGTGTRAKVPDFEVGGKTGTAQKFDIQNGSYRKGAYFSSFIGFAPYDKPRFVCAVFINEPRNGYYGGDVAGPVFSDIISGIIHLKPNSVEKPIKELKKAGLIVPKNNDIADFNGWSKDEVERFMDDRDVSWKFSGAGETVVAVDQNPKKLVLELGQPAPAAAVMPILTGLSVREALSRVNFQLTDVELKGTGLVRLQSIPAGRRLQKKQKLILTCE